MDWNVVVTIYQDNFRHALKALQQFGPTEPSPYHNVLVMKVDDPTALLSAVEQRTQENPSLYDAISRIAPAMRNINFRTADEFCENMKSILVEWAPRLGGRSFHVRVHRRRARSDLHASDTERLFDDVVLDATRRAGTPARLSFTAPDAVIAIDIIDDRAGIALWSREDLAQHRLLRPD